MAVSDVAQQNYSSPSCCTTTVSAAPEQTTPSGASNSTTEKRLPCACMLTPNEYAPSADGSGRCASQSAVPMRQRTRRLSMSSSQVTASPSAKPHCPPYAVEAPRCHRRPPLPNRSPSRVPTSVSPRQPDVTLRSDDCVTPMPKLFCAAIQAEPMKQQQGQCRNSEQACTTQTAGQRTQRGQPVTIAYRRAASLGESCGARLIRIHRRQTQCTTL